MLATVLNGEIAENVNHKKYFLWKKYDANQDKYGKAALILFVILMLSGQIVYCGSIMLCREPTVITAELHSKHSYRNNRRGGNTYIFQVIDDDGLYEEYKVWSNTYSQYEEGDEVTILVYESVFGTEFRHLEEEYN